jgi:signal transduction histidine kinase
MFFARLSAKALWERVSSAVRTLRFRLMLWNFAAGVLTALGILLAVREGVRDTLVNDLDQALREDLKEIKSAFQAPGRQDWHALQDELNRKAATHDYHGWFVMFLGRDGAIAWSSQNTPAGLAQFTHEQRAAGVFHVAQHRIRHETLGAGGEVAAVAVGCNEAFIARDMARIDRLVLIVGGIVVLVAPIGGYLLAGRTTRILADLIHTTDRLRPSELKERLPIRGTGDELDALARTINGLLDRIGDYLQQKHDFLANAAHELRTPLAAIRSSVEVAASGKPSEREFRELLDEVIEQCSALQSLVNQLLLLAESDADRLLTSAEPVSLDELVGRAIDMFQGVAEFHGIELVANRLLPIAVIGNRHRLRQVLNNLLDNAIKFTAARSGDSPPAGGQQPAGTGRIDVRLVRDDQRQVAVLRVADNGIGIASESLPKVFDRFYRADRSRQREGGPGGSGLGLSICQAIVAAHHGTIGVTSEPGRGTTFTITLPLAPAAFDGSPAAIRPVSVSQEVNQAVD